jgi:hypothetical protein
MRLLKFKELLDATSDQAIPKFLAEAPVLDKKIFEELKQLITVNSRQSGCKPNRFNKPISKCIPPKSPPTN